jgi:hypothetical protein
VDNQNIVYMAYDGDNAGRLCGRAILADDPNALHEVSDRINLGHEIVRRWVEGHGGQFISGGGDEGVFSIPAEAINSVEELRADYVFATNLTATIGIGKSLSEAGKAMLVGKFRGKDQVVQFDPSIEGEIKQAQDKLSQGTASAEEKKISEAYLQPEGMGKMATEDTNEQNKTSHVCEYCNAQAAEQVEDPDHCKYCHDEPAASADCQYCQAPAAGGTDDCQYCQGAQDDCEYCHEPAGHDPMGADHAADCKYCQASAGKQVPDANGGTDQQVIATAGPTVKNPTTTDSENYAGQDLNNPDLPKPEAIQHNPDGLSTSMDTPTNENVKLDAQGQGGNNETSNQNVPGTDEESEETVQEIAQQIDALPASQATPQEPVIYTDSSQMATGTNMEDGVSRPEDYADENTPRDMGLGEEEQDQGSPDVTSLMQEGLDSHASDIQKEKVVNLVSEALMGFKNSKAILEKAKLQAPQLYEASIAMLKAMIEMCKMLGLDQTGGGESEGPIGAQGDQVVGQLESQGGGGSAEGADQQANGGVPPAQAHTADAQNPADTNAPVYEKKQDGDSAKKPKGQSANL